MHLRNPELEAALIADPDDLATKLVYADWLLARGAPRGQLIVEQQGLPDPASPLFQWDDPAGWLHAVRQTPIDNRLWEEYRGDLNVKGWIPSSESELARTIRTELFHEVPEHVRVHWRHGFVDGVFFPQRCSLAEDLDQAIDRLLTHPCSLLLRDLVLGAIEWRTTSRWSDRSLHYEPEIEVIAAHAPATLERLVLGAWEEHDVSWTAIGQLEPLYAALPGLRALELQGNGVSLGEIRLPELERFVFRSGGLSEAALREIGQAHWPKLRELELWFGDPDYGGCAEVEAATPFLDPGLPELRVLRLRNSAFTDELCQYLASAPVLAQLEELDLSMGTMSHHGAHRLIAQADAFAHLTRLDLRANGLPPPICELLAERIPQTDTRYQKTEDRRYVSVGE